MLLNPAFTPRAPRWYREEKIQDSRTHSAPSGKSEASFVFCLSDNRQNGTFFIDKWAESKADFTFIIKRKLYLTNSWWIKIKIKKKLQGRHHSNFSQFNAIYIYQLFWCKTKLHNDSSEMLPWKWRNCFSVYITVAKMKHVLSWAHADEVQFRKQRKVASIQRLKLAEMQQTSDLPLCSLH